tara:strand:+ start:5585 stop:6076 length:492 start_codon:yes stop_codon:yes gene_type:complete
MSFPARIDGIGTRLDTSTGSFNAVNLGARKPKFVRLYANATIAKGDAVCFDMSVSTNGIGNHVIQAHLSTNFRKYVIGIAAEAASSGDLLSIQVAGVCEFAKLLDDGDDPGDILSISTTAGQLTECLELDSTGIFQIPCAILAAEGDAATANSTVMLLNPLNL